MTSFIPISKPRSSSINEVTGVPGEPNAIWIKEAVFVKMEMDVERVIPRQYSNLESRCFDSETRQPNLLLELRASEVNSISTTTGHIMHQATWPEHVTFNGRNGKYKCMCMC